MLSFQNLLIFLLNYSSHFAILPTDAFDSFLYQVDKKGFLSRLCELFAVSVMGRFLGGKLTDSNFTIGACGHDVL
jgi:hypothetical protein